VKWWADGFAKCPNKVKWKIDMRKTKISFFTVAGLLLFGLCVAYPGAAGADNAKTRLIITSDTILSGMVEALLPEQKYRVAAILPPGQCPGHYDVKISDIEKMQKADLLISLRGLPFMSKIDAGESARLVIDTEQRNFMAPQSYIFGLSRVATELMSRFPADRVEIARRKEAAIRRISDEAQNLKERIGKANVHGQAILSSSMQREPLEWMGFRIAADYGRPESMSAKDLARLLKVGKEWNVVAVVDNLQSGPDAGKSIAQSLRCPHIVLNNFPTDRGYLSTLKDNVDAVLAALDRK